MKQLSDFEKMAVNTALKKLFHGQKYFSICDVDSIMAVLEIPTGGAVYKSLHLLHCVQYADMPTEVRMKLPELLTEIFQQEFPVVSDMKLIQSEPVKEPVTLPEKGKSGGILQLFNRG